MTYDTQENAGYLYLKGLLSIIYSDNFSDSIIVVKEILNINDDYLLVILMEYLKIWKDAIDIDMKNNIYSLVQLLRDDLSNIEDYDRKLERSNTLNEILKLTRMATDDNMSAFIFDQMRNRYNSLFIALKLLRNIDINELKIYLKLCIQDDFHILCTHSSIVSDDEFEDIINQYVDMDYDYILNINNFIKEWPVLFKDETFMMRVSNVINMLNHKLNNKNDISYVNNVIVPYKKMLKRLEKNLSNL